MHPSAMIETCGLPHSRGGTAVSDRVAEEVAAAREETGSHLRSLKEITGYGIEAQDGPLGQVQNFILDDQSWKIRYLVVNTRALLPGKKVLIANDWVDGVPWDDRQVLIGLTKEQIRQSPTYNPENLVNRKYETRLYDYYGRPRYWE